MTFDQMIGVTMIEVSGCEVGSDSMSLTGGGKVFRFCHEQDCCEAVSINEIHGDPEDLVGSPMLQAEEVSSEGTPAPDGEFVESFTWTFYKFATNKGAVTVKWLGASNGWYSESVDYSVADMKASAD